MKNNGKKINWKSSSGFSAVALVLIMAALLASVGVYFWSKKKNSLENSSVKKSLLSNSRLTLNIATDSDAILDLSKTKSAVLYYKPNLIISSSKLHVAVVEENKDPFEISSTEILKGLTYDKEFFTITAVTVGTQKSFNITVKKSGTTTMSVDYRGAKGTISILIKPSSGEVTSKVTRGGSVTTSPSTIITENKISALTQAVSGNGLVVSWKTSKPSTTQVVYGTTSSKTGDYLSSTDFKSEKSTTHSATISNVSYGSKIYYRAVSIDSSGKKVMTAEKYYTATPVTFTNIKSINSIGEFTTITWTTSVPTYGWVMYGDVSSSAGSYGSESAHESTLSTVHSVQIGNLASNTKIYYRLVAVDSGLNKRISAENNFTTSSSTSVVIKNITSNSADIEWSTATRTTSQVIYDTVSLTAPTCTTSLCTDKTSSTTMSHEVELLALLPNTKYYFRVVSGSTKSGEYSFTTKP